jgi:hypothetical protein
MSPTTGQLNKMIVVIITTTTTYYHNSYHRHQYHKNFLLRYFIHQIYSTSRSFKIFILLVIPDKNSLCIFLSLFVLQVLYVILPPVNCLLHQYWRQLKRASVLVSCFPLKNDPIHSVHQILSQRERAWHAYGGKRTRQNTRLPQCSKIYL